MLARNATAPTSSHGQRLRHMQITPHRLFTSLVIISWGDYGSTSVHQPLKNDFTMTSAPMNKWKVGCGLSSDWGLLCIWVGEQCLLLLLRDRKTECQKKKKSRNTDQNRSKRIWKQFNIFTVSHSRFKMSCPSIPQGLTGHLIHGDSSWGQVQ